MPGKILGMTVQVDEARCDDQPGDIDDLTGIGGVVADGHDASVTYADIGDLIESSFWIDDTTASQHHIAVSSRYHHSPS
ncbi:hypothetical protein BKA07_003182 [Brevibacterium marinum]|uniref:Uncharacterized protein n=1 Tax=Brevibacterium marinum TaxID=418643 RepID=A0A846SBL4_9MICO|nr:hypothetical protein [Brevibacterium marinum]